MPAVAVHLIQSLGITKLDGEAQGFSDQSIRGVGSSAVVGVLRAGDYARPWSFTISKLNTQGPADAAAGC